MVLEAAPERDAAAGGREVIDGTNAQATMAVTCVMRQIAYIDDRDGDYETYLSSVDDRPPTQLTNNSVGDGIPTWSPDGERLAFSSDRDGNQEIYVMNADGTNPVQLTHRPGDSFTTLPAWSIDGKRIAYTRHFGGLYSLWLWDVAAGTSTPFISGPRNVYSSAWRP